ncbi:hypothetical protein AKJ16_DCAP02329 [Drosera capensis]
MSSLSAFVDSRLRGQQHYACEDMPVQITPGALKASGVEAIIINSRSFRPPNAQPRRVRTRHLSA